MDVRNAQKYNFNDQYKTLNGLFKKEYKAVMELYKKSSEYDADDMKDSYKEQVEYLNETYGDNYKFSYKIEDKDKLDKDELEEFEDELRASGKALLNQYDDLDSDDLEELADDSGLSKSQAKKLVSAMEALAKKMKKAKVSAGYELTVTFITTGSELDEPIETERTIYVYKVNGRWICPDFIDMF